MVAAAPFMLAFRFLHIVSGALWVGSTFLFVGIIGPRPPKWARAPDRSSMWP
jgi:hypothetical protein